MVDRGSFGSKIGGNGESFSGDNKKINRLH